MKTKLLIIVGIVMLLIPTTVFGEEELCGRGTILVDGKCAPDYSNENLSYDKTGDCLIATATYGSDMSPQVQMLREIRDNILLSTESGKIFMSGFNTVYYSFSPQIAQLENDNDPFKEAVKLFITPMITTLSIMTLAEENSELDVLFFGMSSIGLIIGMYIVAPVVLVWKVGKRK